MVAGPDFLTSPTLTIIVNDEDIWPHDYSFTMNLSDLRNGVDKFEVLKTYTHGSIDLLFQTDL